MLVGQRIEALGVVKQAEEVEHHFLELLGVLKTSKAVLRLPGVLQLLGRDLEAFVDVFVGRPGIVGQEREVGIRVELVLILIYKLKVRNSRLTVYLSGREGFVLLD